jgi:hypothetical protein
MAVAHRAAVGPNEANPSTGFTITIPATVQSGDDLYVPAMSRSATGSPAIADNDSGGNAWTEVFDVIGDGTELLYHKKATSGTASKTITISGCVDAAAGGLMVASGGYPGTPHTNFTTASNPSGTESTAGFTPDFFGSMVVFLVFNRDDLTVTSPACTDPGALTTRFESTSSAGSDCAIHCASAVQVGGPTATGNFTWDQTDAVNRTLAFAIRPAPNMAALMHHYRQMRSR